MFNDSFIHMKPNKRRCSNPCVASINDLEDQRLCTYCYHSRYSVVQWSCSHLRWLRCHWCPENDGARRTNYIGWRRKMYCPLSIIKERILQKGFKIKIRHIWDKKTLLDIYQGTQVDICLVLVWTIASWISFGMVTSWSFQRRGGYKDHWK